MPPIDHLSKHRGQRCRKTTAMRDLCGVALEAHQDIEALTHELADMLATAGTRTRAPGQATGFDAGHAAVLLRLLRAAYDRGIDAVKATAARPPMEAL